MVSKHLPLATLGRLGHGENLIQCATAIQNAMYSCYDHLASRVIVGGVSVACACLHVAGTSDFKSITPLLNPRLGHDQSPCSEYGRTGAQGNT